MVAHNHTGEKDRKNKHYLRSTIFCSGCDGRMVYSENTGNGGAYPCFVCVKKKTKTNSCRRPAVRLERIENGIADFYATFNLSAQRTEQIRTVIRAELDAQQAEARQSVTRARKRREVVVAKRKKLLSAHYAGAVPMDLLGSEMNRLTREMAEADAEISTAKTTTTNLEAVLDAALAAASNCYTAYVAAPHSVRRQINQGFFEKLFIEDDGSVGRAELTEPFAALLAEGTIERAAAEVSPFESDFSMPAEIVLPSQIAVRPLALVAAGGRDGRI